MIVAMVVLHHFMFHLFSYSIAEDANHAHVEWQSIPQALIFANTTKALNYANQSPVSCERTENKLTTLPKTKIAPEHQWLEDEFPFGMAYFQGLC